MQETPPPAASGPAGAPDVPSASDLPEVPDLSDVPAGAMGALLALPMTLLAKALLVDHDPQLRWLNAFISNDPSSAATSRD